MAGILDLVLRLAGLKTAEEGNALLESVPQLRQFVLKGAKSTGKELGRGAYGCVEEVRVKGVTCAGKRIYETLIDPQNEGADRMVEKYYEECRLLSSLNHPNIVQFLGICFLKAQPGYSPSLPVLVMERLDRSLDDLLENTPNIPLAQKCSILQDVARGLDYLHSRSPAIIHRDLTARNVLLNSVMVAKITDMGNARIVDFQPGESAKTMTKGVPGTAVYMPPEAFDNPPKYGPKLDMFSFGHLALFTMTQVFPVKLMGPTYTDKDRGIIGRSEVKRREEYMDSLRGRFGDSHEMVQLITQCLANSPEERPSPTDALHRLDRVQRKEHEDREKTLLQELKRMKGVEGRKPTPPTGDHRVMFRGIRYNMKRGAVGGNTGETMVVVSVGSECPAGISVQPRVRDRALAEKAFQIHGRLPSTVTGLHEEAAADLMAMASMYLQCPTVDVVRLCLDVPGKQRSKQYYLNTIEEFLKHCKQPVAALNYMGHSEEGTGNWCFKDGTISFQEIFALYRKHCQTCSMAMEIITDCCYSGQWTIDYAKTLDSLGIPPCGHRAREQGILIKVFASCQPDQKATEPCHSVEGVTVKDDGTLGFKTEKLTHQTPTFCEATRLTCYRGPDESCCSDEALKNWTWQEALEGRLAKSVQTVRLSDQGRPTWHYLLLSDKSEEYKKRFVERVKSGSINLTEWGYVMASGEGTDPPQEIRDKVWNWMYI